MSSYDVFISYSHSDATWVRAILVPELEKHHIKVAIDYRDFIPAAPVINEIERCVLESNHVIGILTKRYFKSDWTALERVMTRTMDPSARERKFIPILREKVDLPLSIKMLIYLDLREDDAFEWQRLIQSIK